MAVLNLSDFCAVLFGLPNSTSSENQSVNTLAYTKIGKGPAAATQPEVMMSLDTYTRAADVLRARGHHNLAEYCRSRTISAETGCPIVEAMLFLEHNGRAFMAEAYMEKLITVDELLRDAVETAASC